LVALARTDTANAWKASADVRELWEAWLGLWSAVRNYSNGEPVAVPLFGHGQAQVPLSANSLLRLLLISIRRASRDSLVCDDVHVIVRPDVYAELELRGLD
jgi:hypothetical protein